MGALVWRAKYAERRVWPKASPCCPPALQKLPTEAVGMVLGMEEVGYEALKW